MNDDYSPLHVQETQHVKFDRTAFMASGGTVKLGETIVDGTFEIEASAIQEGETLTIEADNFLINSHTDPNDIGRRRRDTFVYNNGKIVIGTEENPIPCGSQVVLKINGDKNSRSFGATPGNPPIGPKAIGGFGGIEMWGCAPANTWTQLLTTVNSGASAITIMGDITGWKAGDEIAVASTSYEHRHTEYVTIQSISGNVIAIFPALEHRHTGAATSTQTINGVDYNQAAEVTLLTRSIKIDGTDFTDDKVGGRIVILNWIRMNGAHFYEHHGYGQFSNVQFTGMGQYAYTSYDDNRAAIMFWGIDTTADTDLGRKESFVKGCAFHDLYHTAVAALFDTDNLVIDNNIIMGAVDDAIRSDGVGTVITNNVIGNIEATALYKGAFASGTNVNFEEDQLPSCVNIKGATDTTLTGNRCTGTDGSCFQTDGESCDVSEMCGFTTNGYSFANNVGHSCAIGHWNLESGSGCAKYAGYYFYKIAYYGFQWYTDINYNIVEDSVVLDAKVGFYGVSSGIGPDKRNTIKNTYFAGKSDFFDCAYDADVHQSMELSKHAGSLNPTQVVPGTQHAAVLFPDFHQDKNGFPICQMFAADVDPNNHGLTCMLDCHFADYNRKCGDKDVLFKTNILTMDWTFPIQLLGGNQKTNVNMDDLVQYDRPTLDKVNIADCVDLHGDANKHAKVMDIDGGVFDVPGTLFAESEYEWDGVTRATADGGSITYSDTRDGLGDYRIPKPLITAMDGSKIPIDDVIQERGIVRNANCDYRPDGPAWFCPLSDFRYYDLVYDMMDNDKMSRRLTPLALVANGHADIINGPCDHSCCIGYACSLRLMTLHSTVACGQDYDYYFSSTTPLKAKWYFADAPADCKILVKFYSKRPNRMNFFMDGELSLATNAVLMGDSISWSKPDPSFFPGLTDSIYSHGGANYHDRNNQLFYMILSGGSNYDLEVVSTLVLELGVMTEVTEDEFYDNGNLAANIAALLGIDPSKIRLMNVISETGSQRRKRRAALGYDVINVDINPRFRNRRQDDAPGMTLGFEIDPSSNTANGAEANNKLGATIVGSGGSIVENVMNTTTSEIDPSATADENVAIAAAPEPPPEEPEEPETLADILGIDNIAEGESLDDFLEKVKDELDVPLEDLETAEEKNAEKQAAADAALEAVVYTSPAELLVLSEPTEPQILALEFYQKFSFAMKDTNGEIMPIVGFVAEPWNVKVTFGDNVITSGPASPNLDGLTSVDFVAGDGRSIFSNLVVKGDVVSANFIFTAVNPGIAEDTGISWTSPVVEFLPPADTSVCDAKPEGSPFDKKMAFSPDCSYVCITGCNAVGAAPICETVTSCDASSYSTCGDSGCACDMSLVPEVESINVADYISGTCDGSGLTMRVNKCVVNKLGLMLKDIHVVGEQVDDFSTIAQDANCRGRLGFDTGAEYVFQISRSKSECGATTTFNSTHVSYSAGIQGYKMVSDFYTRDVAEFWSSFECSYPIDLSSYTELATAQKMNNVVEGRNVMVAKYTDAGYHTIAPTDQAISSESLISELGMVAPEGFQLEANRCWFSDAYNADDEDAGNTLEVVTDGCLTSGQEGWVSIAEGWSGTSQFRMMITDSILSEMGSDIVYFNCMVSLCDLDSGACSDASCPGSNTASGTQIRVHAELNLDNADAVAACDTNAQNCENCKATMNGDVCFCQDGFVLQGDNSCAASRVLKEHPIKKWQKKWQKNKN
ncbi:unnamed protein product [Oikopleura dioica]|nr:unnamed protein product [Oikopleura dioica]